MTTPNEPPSQNGTAAPAPSEPWWKRAPAGPPPKWASPVAVRRSLLQRSVLPSRMTARTNSVKTEPSGPTTPKSPQERAEPRASQP